MGIKGRMRMWRGIADRCITSSVDQWYLSIQMGVRVGADSLLTSATLNYV